MKKAHQKKDQKFIQSEEVIHHDVAEAIRLNKYIGSTGFCSRREADRYIEAGRVSVDGEVATTGVKVEPHQIVCVDGKPISVSGSMVYLILHKPVGIICTTDTQIEDNIIDYMQYPTRIFPVGRLDRDSSGLIILTSDGDVVNKILRAHNEKEKEYIVKVDHAITPSFLSGLAQGVNIYNPVSHAYQITNSCKVEKIDMTSFRIIISQGLNRQIRRMCSAFEYHVQNLKRVRIMNLTLDELEVGEWRYLTSDEIKTLNEQLSHAVKTTNKEA